jgi:hypothetical protein
MSSKSARKKCEPFLKLHGRVLMRDWNGAISDVTEEGSYSLKKLAEDGELVIHILNQCRQRLDLLALAAEHRSHMDTSLVRLVVQDLKSDLEKGSELHGYIHLTHEMFEHAEALPPLPTPDPRTPWRTLSLIEPVSRRTKDLERPSEGR